eukprot:scaffold148438_cov26-Tisochrysis_lutea.AAC.2
MEVACKREGLSDGVYCRLKLAFLPLMLGYRHTIQAMPKKCKLTQQDEAREVNLHASASNTLLFVLCLPTYDQQFISVQCAPSILLGTYYPACCCNCSQPQSGGHQPDDLPFHATSPVLPKPVWSCVRSHCWCVLQSLFFFVQGLKAIEDVEPYLKRHSGVFVTASGTGFYEQCFPSNRYTRTMCLGPDVLMTQCALDQALMIQCARDPMCSQPGAQMDFMFGPPVSFPSLQCYSMWRAGS